MKIGDRIRIIESVIVYHHPEHRQQAFDLKDRGWEILNSRWIIFFIFVAVLNEIVWRTQSEVFWVNFKVWGLLPISLVFAACQVTLINKYKLK